MLLPLLSSLQSMMRGEGGSDIQPGRSGGELEGCASQETTPRGAHTGRGEAEQNYRQRTAMTLVVMGKRCWGNSESLTRQDSSHLHELS